MSFSIHFTQNNKKQKGRNPTSEELVGTEYNLLSPDKQRVTKTLLLSFFSFTGFERALSEEKHGRLDWGRNKRVTRQLLFFPPARILEPCGKHRRKIKSAGGLVCSYWIAKVRQKFDFSGKVYLSFIFDQWTCQATQGKEEKNQHGGQSTQFVLLHIF